MLMLALLVALVQDAQAFYNPNTGRWLSRDPLSDAAFLDRQTIGKDWSKLRDLYEQAKLPSYLFVKNAPSVLIDADGLACVFDPTRAGTADFVGFDALALNDIRLIPENGTTMTTPSNGRSGDIDGFWWRHSRQWFKVPNHCHCTITWSRPFGSVEGSFSSDCCCNSLCKGIQNVRGRPSEAGWYDDVQPTNHGTDYPF